jgi:transposase
VKHAKPNSKAPAGVPVHTATGALPMTRGLLSAGIELDAATEREREARLETLKGELLKMATQGDVAALIDKTLGVVLALERENERLSWRLLRALRYRFGRQSEKLSREELAQFCLALGGSEADAAAIEPLVPAPAPDGTQADQESSEEPDAKRKKRNRKVGGAIVLAPSVERVITDVPVPPGERACALCGEAKSSIGPVDHERIEFIPAKVVVRIERREQLACSACRKDVSVAPRVALAVDRRIAPSMLAKLLTQKCANGMPLDRQRRELARMGADIPDKTLASCWAYATDALEPVALVTLADVLASPIVGADDTHLKTLDRHAKGGSFRGRFWCFVGTDGTVGAQERVAYGYAQSWKAEEIQEWFSAIDGLIQCDAYAGYATECEDEDGETVVAVPDERRLGCMMHVRSKFHAALLGKDKRAAIPLKLIGDLYAIEAQCKSEGLDATARGDVRRARSVPLLDELDRWVDDMHPRLLPKAPLRQATQYAQNQRDFVRRTFDDGRFEIDNGRTERRIRPFAVGRRGFLFTGSRRGGERLAIAYTLVDNCILLGLDPQPYLQDVLTKLASGWPMRRLSELTPHRWMAEHLPEKQKTEPPERA